MFNVKFPLFSPIGDGEGSSNTNDDINFLGEGEEPEKLEEHSEEPEEGESEEETPKEIEEESEEQEEEPEEGKEEPEEGKEDEPLHARPSIAEINKKYPNLFKDFPDLREVYFREQEFSKLFPTVGEAKEAIENNEAFSNIREDVMSGTGEKLFSAIKETGNLEKFSNTILGTLLKVDQNAFWRAVNPFAEDLLRGVFNKGKLDGGEDGENLQNAARVISKFFFNSTDVAEGKRTTVLNTEKADESVKGEREQWEQEKQDTFSNDVKGSGVSQLRKSIIGKSDDGEKIDPDGVLTPWMKDQLADKILDEIDKQMGADKTHIAYMNSLWEKAKASKYSSESKNRIISAYLSRARQLVPSIRAKLLAEATGKHVRSGVDKQRKVEEIRNRRDNNSGRNSSGRSSTLDAKKIDWSKTTDDDLLNDNVTLKN